MIIFNKTKRKMNDDILFAEFEGITRNVNGRNSHNITKVRLRHRIGGKKFFNTPSLVASLFYTPDKYSDVPALSSLA